MHKPPYVIKTGNCSNTQSGAITQGLVFKEIGSWSSVKTPNFKLVKSRRMLPWNNFSSGLETQKFQAGTYGSYPYDAIPDAFIGYTGQCFEKIEMLNASAFRRLDLSDLDYKARSKVLDKLKYQSVNLAVSFGERKQTVNMLAKTVNRLATAALAIRKGNLRHASSLFGIQRVTGKSLKKEIAPHPSNLANYWLEFTYGWKPLLSDIYGSAIAIAKTYEVDRPLRVAVIVGTDLSGPRYESGHCVSGIAGSYSRRMVTSSGSAECRYIVEFVESNTLLSSLAQLGLTNPLDLAWELLPYSFVIDWALPIGSYLNRLDATSGLAFKRGSVSVRWTEDHICTWSDVGVWNRKASYVRNCDHSFHLESKSRSILAGFPSPPVPSFQKSLGLIRALSGLSLLQQAFGRKH